MSSVFLSHSHADKTFARKLARDLRGEGHIVWIDEAEINVGDSLLEKIGDGLAQVEFVAAILSKTSIDSAWVKRELEVALNREIREKRVVVLPVLVDDVTMPTFLSGKKVRGLPQRPQLSQGIQRDPSGTWTKSSSNSG